MQGLFDDERSASQRALDAARAQAAADAARLGAQQAHAGRPARRRPGQLGRHGGRLARRAAGAALDRLFAARAALLQAQAAPGAALPPGTMHLDAGATARPLAGGGAGQRFYLVDTAGLAPGQRLWGRAAGPGAQVDGAWVPASAVVWHAGQAWIYLLQGADDDDAPAAGRPAAGAASEAAARFRRRALAGAERVDEGWFVPGLDGEDTVVVQGAQVLLSEELKFQLRNENDD
ncbi:MAG: hypothetical protein U1F53_00900 [Burkholderiaceae bacterium]